MGWDMSLAAHILHGDMAGEDDLLAPVILLKRIYVCNRRKQTGDSARGPR